MSKRAYRAYKALVYECTNRGYAETTKLTLLAIDRHVTALKRHQVAIDFDAGIVMALCLPSSMKDVDRSAIHSLFMTMLDEIDAQDFASTKFLEYHILSVRDATIFRSRMKPAILGVQVACWQ